MSAYASTSRAAYPPFFPPSLSALSDPRPHPNPSSLPPSRRPWGKHATLQDELDDLEAEEDEFYNHMMDVRQYGYSWLVPLGRQNTHDEDAEDAFHPHGLPSSPGAGNDTFDSATGAAGGVEGQPPPAGGGGNNGPAVEEPPVIDLDADIEDADASAESSVDGTGSEAGESASERGGGEGRGTTGGGGDGGGEESMQM
ncbi:hypothetical protein JCM6882_008822 [Rhodosporidiobolus microsporus]